MHDRAVGIFGEHDPDSVRHLRREAVKLEGGNQADDCPGRARAYGRKICMPGGCVSGVHVHAAGEPHKSPTIDRPL